MKIAIIGAGGVGGYFGGKMAQAGYDVTFVVRGKHFEAIKKDGLAVKSIKGDFHIEKAQVVEKISDLESIDLVILGVKAWQVKEIANDISKIITESSTVLPLQNGVMAADELLEVIPKENVIGGLCRIFSKIDAPGVINHLSIEPTIIYGELNNENTERISTIKSILDKSGITNKIARDIHAELWKKFIAICVSGLLAVSNSSYGQVRELKESRQLMYDLILEVYNLSQKMGINIKPEFVDKSVEFIDTFPYNTTSSLTRDVWEGKPSEIEYQNGSVVRLGEKKGIDTPINKFIYNCILPQERKARMNGN